MHQYTSGEAYGFQVGRSRKDVLGHPIHILVITSDLSANPVWEGGDTEMFSRLQTHQIGD